MKKNIAAVALAVGIFLACGFLAFHLHKETEKQVLAQFNEHQILIARQTARQIESYFHARSRDVQSLSSYPSLRHLDAKTMQTDVQANFNRLKTVHIKEIFILDAKGKVICSSPGEAIGSNYTRSDIHDWAKKPANRGLVRLVMEKSDRQGTPEAGEGTRPPSPRPFLAAPLYQESVAGGSPGPDGKFAGILLLTVDLEKMLADRTLVFTSTNKLDTLWIMAADEDGTILLQSEHPEMVFRSFRDKNRECNRCHGSFDYVEKILTAKQGTVEYQLEGRQRKVAAFAPMTFEDISWIVVVNAPKTEVTGFIKNNLVGVVGLIGIVALALGLASFFIYRNHQEKMVVEKEVRNLQEKHGLVEELRETRDYLENLFGCANAPIIVWDPEFRITRFNRAFEHMTGYAASEVLGRELSLLFPEGSRDELLSGIARTLSGEHWESVEIPIIRKDGETQIALLNSANIYAADGTTVVATIAQGQDITERKKAEESRLRMAQAIEQSAETIVITDTAGKIQYVNPSFELTTGYSRVEAIGQNPRILKSGKQNEAFYRKLWETISSGETFKGNMTNRRKDGSLYEEEATISPVFGSSGKIINFVAVNRDVTRERLLQKQVETAQRMESVGKLTGGIAHDFNNTLTGILGYSELLRIRLADNPKALADLDEISRAAEHAATLTRQLLTFARRQVVDLANMDLREVVKDAVKFFAKVAGEQIEVKTLVAADTPTVRADRGQIEQVLMNLLINSKDAMTAGGQLLVETGEVILEEEYIRKNEYMKKGRYALLVVSDTGIGMDEATRERVFEPFFTTKTPDKGTGLGLSVVYGIVKQHNGYIHVYSEPGKGSAFKVYFPAVEGPADVRIPVRTEPVLGGNETILLADDEESIRTLAERILKDTGYTVITARNGEEAVEAFRRRKEIISLAVLDVVMPGLGGKEAFEVMRKENPGLKVIFMSGYSAHTIHDSFVLRPDTPFLGKPFSPMVLARKVREVLDKG